MARQRLSRQEILDFMEQNWDDYLATLDALPENERQAFASAQGYPDAKTLLAHITAWWREATKNIRAMMAGQQPNPDYDDDDEFNARVIEGARLQTEEQVQADFENTREEIAGLVAELPDAALDNPRIYEELYGEIVSHYQQHVPPGG